MRLITLVLCCFFFSSISLSAQQGCFTGPGLGDNTGCTSDSPSKYIIHDCFCDNEWFYTIDGTEIIDATTPSGYQFDTGNIAGTVYSASAGWIIVDWDCEGCCGDNIVFELSYCNIEPPAIITLECGNYPSLPQWNFNFSSENICSDTPIDIGVEFSSEVTVNEWTIDGATVDCIGDCSQITTSQSVGQHTICFNITVSEGACESDYTICKDIEFIDCSCIFEVLAECDFCGIETYTVVDGTGEPVGSETELEWQQLIDGEWVVVSNSNPFVDNSGIGGLVNVANRRCDCDHSYTFETLKCDDCELLDNLPDGSFQYDAECHSDGSATFTANLLGEELPECSYISWVINDQIFNTNPVTVFSDDPNYSGHFAITFMGDDGKRCTKKIEVLENCECAVTIPDGLTCALNADEETQVSWNAVPDAVAYIVQVIMDDPFCCSVEKSSASFYVTTENTFILISELGISFKECFSIRVRAKCSGGDLGAFSEKICPRSCESDSSSRANEGVENRSSDYFTETWSASNPIDQTIGIYNLDTRYNYSIRLYSTEGLLLMENFIDGLSELNIPTGNLESGLYIMSVYNEERQTVKTVKLLKK